MGIPEMVKPNVRVFSHIRFFLFLMKQSSNILAVRKFAGVCLLVTVFSATCGWARTADVRLLQSDRTGVVIEFTPAYNAPAQNMINGKQYSSYTFDSYALPQKPIPGAPELFERQLVLRFPGIENNTVDLVKTEYEDIPNVFLAPFPGYQKTEFGYESYYRENGFAPALTGFIPASIAVVTGVGEARGAFLGQLRISPIQYNPVSRTVRRYTKIICRVNFGSASISHAMPDGMVKGVALNDDQFPDSQTRLRLAKSAITNSVLSSGVWFRIPVTEEGMYKITGQMLLNAGIPSSVDPSTIKIFGNGGYELPTDVSASVPDDLLENSVLLYDNDSPRQLNASDYLIFFGKGTRGWVRNQSGSFSHYLNHFTETNYYWLTFGGNTAKHMNTAAALPAGSYTQAQTVTEKIFREDEMVNIISSGMEWMGQSMNVGDNVAYTHPLPGLDPTQKMIYRFRLGAQSHGYSLFTVYEHTAQIGTSRISYIGNDDYAVQLYETTLEDSLLPTFTNGQSYLRFNYTSTGSSGTGYIDWYELFYQRKLVANNDVFAFTTPGVSGTAEYPIGGFSNGQATVFDVTKFDSTFIVPGSLGGSNNTVVDLQYSSGNIRQIYAIGPGGYKTPGSLQRLNNQNLHGDTTNVEYIIVTHSDFRSAADRLRNYRQQAAGGGLKTLVVDVDSIYNEFGGGLSSPAAIRNYLKYKYQQSSGSLKYVLLFGNGDFDYKGIISKGTNWIPAWETEESFSPLDSYCSDDDFGTFFPGGKVSVGIGRLTARSLSDANTMVDKILEYESKSAVDAWKTRVTFVADDGPTSSGHSDSFTHVNDAEGVAVLVPSLFKKDKIYLAQYPTVYTAGGRRKPDVNKAVVDHMNNGTLLINFTGHGNPRLWCHEEAFVRESDFSSLHNKGKYFFLVAATCNFALYDGLSSPSGGELLAAMPDAGAVGVFSATRAVFQDSNHLLNLTLFENLFPATSTGMVKPQRIGNVIFRTKQDRYDDNDRKYFLLGDPALQLGFPKLFASIDSIDHKPGNSVVQLQALSAASISATVLDSANSGAQPFSGKALTEVFDAKKTIVLDDVNSAGNKITEPIPMEGDVLFRGEATVAAGKLQSKFIVPKDISYSNDYGKINVYFWNQTTDGAGYTTNVKIGGTDSTAASDAKGPAISLYIGTRSFRSGDVVGADPLLIADLEDEHGINTSGAGIGHRLEAWIDGASQSIDLTNFYESAIDNYRKGTVQYVLSGLSQGNHRLRVRVWDTYNNPSSGEVVFDVMTGVGMQLTNIFNYPNPFSGPTVFTFEHNQVGNVKAEVKIYTVAGRLIRSISADNLVSNNQVVQVPWDGRDQDGSRIANGVYLYKVIAKTEDERFTSEAYGKLSVVR
jgi:hypothetical protein